MLIFKMIGKMSIKDLAYPVLIDGETLVPRSGKKCLQCLKKPVFLLHHAVIGWFCLYATW
jgi:hypothetical protein